MTEKGNAIADEKRGKGKPGNDYEKEPAYPRNKHQPRGLGPTLPGCKGTRITETHICCVPVQAFSGDWGREIAFHRIQVASQVFRSQGAQFPLDFGAGQRMVYSSRENAGFLLSRLFVTFPGMDIYRQSHIPVHPVPPRTEHEDVLT